VTLFPASETDRNERYPQHSLKGTVTTRGDIISPALPPEAWDANRGEWEP
jgi:hypothetical protein